MPPCRGRPLLPVAALAGAAAGCSWVSVREPGGTHVIGRTMETGGGAGGLRSGGPAAQPPQDYRVVTHPRGEAMAPSADHCGGTHVSTSGWMNWTSSYGFVGIDQLGSLAGGPTASGPGVLLEGINEHGLTMSMHSLRQSEYPKPGPGVRAVCYIDLALLLLGTCRTVGDAVAALRDVSPIDPVYALAPSGTRGHWGVQDATGASVVLEYLSGELHVHNNTVGVLTNDPDFTWQLRNLNNYVGIQPGWPRQDASVTVATEIGTVPLAVGHGANLLGLPGDATPPSRFARLFYLRELAQRNLPVQNVTEAIVLAQTLLNSVAVVKGSVAVAGAAEGDETFDFTQYAVLKLPEARRFIYRSYYNMQWKQLDLTRLSFDRFSAVPLYDGTAGVLDVTPEP